MLYTKSAKGKYYKIVFKHHSFSIHLNAREISRSSCRAWYNIRCYQMVFSNKIYIKLKEGSGIKKKGLLMLMSKRNLLNI